jgi:excisionase family DNA binding protein
MAETSLAVSRQRLTELTVHCEDLLGQADSRAGMLAEMRELGGRIDEAYARFESSPRAEADRLQLSRTQLEIQTRIEALRPQADAVLAEWRDFHRAAGEGLVEVARHAPAALSAAKSFKRLPTPNDSEPKLQLLRVRELLDKALRLTAAPESPSAPAKAKRAREAEGLMTAKEVALLCGISDKTVYRLASEGRIPYTRIQSSLRFKRRDVYRWIEAKSFQPKSIRKANPVK